MVELSKSLPFVVWTISYFILLLQQVQRDKILLPTL